MSVSRAVRLRECPLEESWLYYNIDSVMIFQNWVMTFCLNLDISQGVIFSWSVWNKKGGSPCFFLRNHSRKDQYPLQICLSERGLGRVSLPVTDHFSLTASETFFSISPYQHCKTGLYCRWLYGRDVAMLCALEVHNAQPGNTASIYPSGEWNNYTVNEQMKS